MTVAACKAGKDVWVEKPICTTVEEGQKMMAAARKYNRVVQVGTMQRSGDVFKRASEDRSQWAAREDYDGPHLERREQRARRDGDSSGLRSPE